MGPVESAMREEWEKYGHGAFKYDGCLLGKLLALDGSYKEFSSGCCTYAADAVGMLLDELGEPQPETDTKTAAEKMNDDIKSPYHYIGDDEVDCTRATKAMLSGYALGQVLPYQEAHWCANTLKYLWRWSRKGGIKDLKKAREYLDYVIKSAGSRDMTVDPHFWIRELMDPQPSYFF